MNLLFASDALSQESALMALLRATADARMALVPLVLATAALILVVRYRTRALDLDKVFPREFVDEIKFGAVKDYQPARLESRCQAFDGESLLVAPVRALIATAGRGYVACRNAVDHAIDLEIAKLQRLNAPVEVIYAGSTLLGLLGSALGLVIAFRKLALATNFDTVQSTLNATVAAALTATALSILLALVALAVSRLFLNDRVEQIRLRLASDLEPLLLFVSDRTPVIAPAAESTESPKPTEPATASRDERDVDLLLMLNLLLFLGSGTPASPTPANIPSEAKLAEAPPAVRNGKHPRPAAVGS